MYAAAKRGPIKSEINIESQSKPKTGKNASELTETHNKTDNYTKNMKRS